MGFDDRFAYVSGRIWALEDRMVDRAKFNRLIDAGSPEELVRILSETEYGQGREIVPERYEEIIDAELVRVHQLIAELSPDPELTGVFRAKHDFHNMKVHLKSRLVKRDWDMIVREGLGLSQVGWIDPDRLGEYADAIMLEYYPVDEEEEDDPGERDDFVAFDGSDEILATTPLEDAIIDAGHKAVEAYMRHGRDPQYIDFVIDRASYDYFHHVAVSRRAVRLEEIVATMADLTNIQICMRLRAIGKDACFASDVLVPHGTLDAGALLGVYEKPDSEFVAYFRDTPYARLVEDAMNAWLANGSLVALENLAEGYLFRKIAPEREAVVGYETALAYLGARELEADKLRRIFVGKMNKIPPNVIRERLSGAYA
ncbi:MAG: V-type ATPase subunit [Bacillota bacterium]